MMRHFPLFITIEGGEGSGKSTLMGKLYRYLQEQGYDAIQTREPGGTPLGNRIRELLLSSKNSVSIDDKAELLLFLASRAQQIEQVILPSLGKGKVVLCDRFNDSTVAYQGCGRKLGIQEVKRLCEFVTGTLRPDLTFFLDVEPLDGLKRSLKIDKKEAQAGELDRIEQATLEFHTIIRDYFLKITEEEPDRVKRIDAMQPIEAVYEKALFWLKSKL